MGWIGLGTRCLVACYGWVRLLRSVEAMICFGTGVGFVGRGTRHAWIWWLALGDGRVDSVTTDESKWPRRGHNPIGLQAVSVALKRR